MNITAFLAKKSAPTSAPLTSSTVPAIEGAFDDECSVGACDIRDALVACDAEVGGRDADLTLILCSFNLQS